MTSTSRTILAGLTLLLTLAAPVSAQYMYLDSNGDGVNDASDTLNPYGPTTFDVWLNTGTDRAGTEAVCITEGGIPDPGTPLDVFSYELTLMVSGGTVTWLSFTNLLPNFARISSQQSGSDYSWNFFGTSSFEYILHPGLHKLARIVVDVSSGVPTIAIASRLPSVGSTSLGSPCLGTLGFYTLYLGLDWFDVDGLGPAPTRVPPLVTAPADGTVDEGLGVLLQDHSVDPDVGQTITITQSGTPLGLSFSSVPGPSPVTATISGTPGFADQGVYTIVWTASDGVDGFSSATTVLTVRNVNRPPVASAGGPYTGAQGVPLQLDGSGSFDPDGNGLSYLWDFGDQNAGLGPQPMHLYGVGGTYAIGLTVNDGVLSATAATTAQIQSTFQARAFTTKANQVIRLASLKPFWCAQLEPAGGAFNLADVALSTLRLRSVGTGTVSQIAAVSGKSAIASDTDGNGLAELAACFAKQDLRLLFALVQGKQSVPVSLEGELTSGAAFLALMDVGVIGGGGSLTATVSPNPLNPDATLSFTTATAGPARVEVFDPAGKRVRVLLDDPWLSAGFHALPIDGRTQSGVRMPTGVYFYRIRTAEGDIQGRFAILK